MIIAFSPLRSDAALVVSRQGDTLSVNGETFDFSALSEGASLPRAAVACDWLASDVTREEGRLKLTLSVPHVAEACEAVRFPDPIEVVGDGCVPLPRDPVTKDSQ